MRFIAVQTSPSWMDVTASRLAVEAQVTETSPEEGDFVVLPEMCETGWTSDAALCGRAYEAASPPSIEWFSALAKRFRIWLQAGFAERLPGGRHANSVAILSPEGEHKATYRKNFLFPSEQSAFAAGDAIVVLDLGPVRVCPLICYDLRFPELWRLATRAGAEAFTVSSSWPSVRHEHWRQLLVARAIENQALVIAANRTGNDPTLAYSGGSVAIDPLGLRVAECGEPAGSASMVLDREAFDAWRARFGALRDTRASLLGSIRVERAS